MADDSSLVYGWCGVCQQHTVFPHDCDGEPVSAPNEDEP